MNILMKFFSVGEKMALFLLILAGVSLLLVGYPVSENLYLGNEWDWTPTNHKGYWLVMGTTILVCIVKCVVEISKEIKTVTDNAGKRGKLVENWGNIFFELVVLLVTPLVVNLIIVYFAAADLNIAWVVVIALLTIVIVLTGATWVQFGLWTLGAVYLILVYSNIRYGISASIVMSFKQVPVVYLASWAWIFVIGMWALTLYQGDTVSKK